MPRISGGSLASGEERRVRRRSSWRRPSQSSVSWATRKPAQKRPSRGARAARPALRASARSSQPMPSRSLPCDPPEDVEAGRELQRRPRIDQQKARERDASVVLDATEHFEVRPLRPGHASPRIRLKRDAEVEARVAIADAVELAGGGELLDGVLADRLEQLIPAAVALLQEERLLDEPGSEVCDLRRRSGRRSRRPALIAARSNPPANTAIRRRGAAPPRVSRASLHSTVARSDRCAPSARRASLREQSRTDRRGAARCPPDRARPPARPRARWRAGGHRRGGRSLRRDGRRARCRATPASCAPARSRNRRTAGLAVDLLAARVRPTTGSGASR